MLNNLRCTIGDVIVEFCTNSISRKSHETTQPSPTLNRILFMIHISKTEPWAFYPKHNSRANHCLQIHYHENFVTITSLLYWHGIRFLLEILKKKHFLLNPEKTLKNLKGFSIDVHVGLAFALLSEPNKIWRINVNTKCSTVTQNIMNIIFNNWWVISMRS